MFGTFGKWQARESPYFTFGTLVAFLFVVTLKIVRRTEDGTTILTLSGRIRSGDIEEIRNQIGVPRMRIAFDLKDVTLVDRESVRFLGFCESEGARLVNCALYIREWILRERNLGRVCE
jgi:hypothetical protein